jgi:hypothetical protein
MLWKIDRALTLVGGSRTAAAKLIDLTRDELNHAVNNHPALREKWGLKKRGRPRSALSFTIREHCPEQASRALRQAGLAQEVYSMVSDYLGVERAHELLFMEQRQILRRLCGERVVPPPPED